MLPMLLCLASTLNIRCYPAPAGHRTIGPQPARVKQALLTVVKVYPAGAVACPSLFQPQQTAEPSDRSPHVCNPPLLTVVKVYPAGAVAWPEPFQPQQATEPLDRSPHVCNPPLLTVVKVYPAGAVAWPW